MSLEISVTEKLKNIRLLVLDVDGVLTDGKLYFSETGEALKTFNTLDGHGIKMLQKAGIEVAIITGREHPAVLKRASDLGIKHILCGREDKHQALLELLQGLPFSHEQTAMMGDDWPDLLAMQLAGFSATVPNAAEAVLEYADWCSTKSGGTGAVREFCEAILKAQDLYELVLSAYLQKEH